MPGDVASDIASALQSSISADPAAPLITYYDQGTGERTELSGITSDNWISKTANYLIDELLVEPGGIVALAMPPHWQTFAIVHAAWRIGACVSDAAYAENPDALFVGPQQLDELADTHAAEVVVSSLDAMGRPYAARPAHVHDYTSEVRLHGDQFSGPPVDPALPAVVRADRALNHEDALIAARSLAAASSIGAGDRILADVRALDGGDALSWALLPVAVGASLVMALPARDASTDDAADWLDRIAAQEQTTRTVGAQPNPG